MPTEARNPGRITLPTVFAISTFCVINLAVTTSIGFVNNPVKNPADIPDIRSIIAGFSRILSILSFISVKCLKEKGFVWILDPDLESVLTLLLARTLVPREGEGGKGTGTEGVIRSLEWQNFLVKASLILSRTKVGEI